MFKTTVKSKHYTPLEKSTFLECLKRHKDVIEARRSDAATLAQKERAWSQVVAEFNNSRFVVQERSANQLKKLWANLKQGQRNAITKERQERLATGGGPEPAASKVDPDVAIIVPHLMETVPTVFSSNIDQQNSSSGTPELDQLERQLTMLEKGITINDEKEGSDEERVIAYDEL